MYNLLNNAALYLKEEIGDKAELRTENKSTIVAAINEITSSGSVDLVARELIHTEMARATAEDAALSQAISLETSRAYEAERVILNKLDEVNTFSNGIVNSIAELNTSLTNNINSVNATLVNSIAELNTSLMYDINNVSNTLTNNINNVNANLTNSITELNTSLTNNINNVNANLTNSITELNTSLTAAKNDITNVSTDIANEVIRATGVEVTKANKIEVYTKKEIDELLARINNPLAAHPLHSYYWSDDPTDPAELFGGKWERVKNVFLWAADDDEIGKVDGEREHLLTVSELPKHNHNTTDSESDGTVTSGGMSTRSSYGFNIATGGRYGGGTTSGYLNQVSIAHTHTVALKATGGSTAHNNMPPFYGAYCWRRIE